MVLKNALLLANVIQHAILHWLSHSTVTWLPDGESYPGYIQENLIHKCSGTTKICTYASSPTLQQIKSPIENL